MEHVNSRGTRYFLHSKAVALRNGLPSRIYYFRREPDPPNQMKVLPMGFEVSETKNGLPVLRKKKVLM